MVVGCRLSGVGVDCRLYLSVVGSFLLLIIGFRLPSADCRLLCVPVGVCCWFLLVGCRLLVVIVFVCSSSIFPMSVPSSADRAVSPLQKLS
jgi:hypothetical protein